MSWGKGLGFLTYVGPKTAKFWSTLLTVRRQEMEMILAIFALNQSLGGDGLRYPILKWEQKSKSV